MSRLAQVTGRATARGGGVFHSIHISRHSRIWSHLNPFLLALVREAYAIGWRLDQLSSTATAAVAVAVVFESDDSTFEFDPVAESTRPKCRRSCLACPAVESEADGEWFEATLADPVSGVAIGDSCSQSHFQLGCRTGHVARPCCASVWIVYLMSIMRHSLLILSLFCVYQNRKLGYVCLNYPIRSFCWSFLSFNLNMLNFTVKFSLAWDQ